MNKKLNRIYGVILNDKKTLETLAPELSEAPYKAPAKAPVLYIKTENTLNATGSVTLPQGVEALEVGATLGLVIGKTATRLTAENALEVVGGVVVAVDLSVPHDSYYRPAIREKCFDGSLLLSDVVPYQDVSALTLNTDINGNSSSRALSALQRDAVQLLVDVTEFMTLAEGDVLLLGVEYQAPQVKSGETATVSCEGLGAVNFSVHNNPTTGLTESKVLTQHAPRVGRVLIDGQVYEVTPADGDNVKTADGRVFAEAAVTWLPPFAVGKIFALGLNYADHAAELAFKAPEVPLVFLKGGNTIVGHNANTRRPDGTEYMHYECELAIVIGKTAKNVKAADADDYVLGYTVANDYAIRDYLENYYRPNLRVKNRDGCTPIGPWLTRTDQIADPMNLKLTTRINGKTTQEGTTKDMIFSVKTLVEYLSSIMTLQPGDVILTGTPEGLADTKHGDIIETEIEGLGVLRNTIVDNKTYFEK